MILAISQTEKLLCVLAHPKESRTFAPIEYSTVRDKRLAYVVNLNRVLNPKVPYSVFHSNGLSNSLSLGCLISFSDKIAFSAGILQSIPKLSSKIEMPPSDCGA